MEERQLIHVNTEQEKRTQTHIDKMNTSANTLKRIFKNTVGADATIGDISENGASYFVEEFWKKYKNLYPPVSNAQKIYEASSGVSLNTISEKIEQFKTLLNGCPVSIKTNKKDEYVANVRKGHWNIYLHEDKAEQYKLAQEYIAVCGTIKSINSYSPIINALRFAPAGWLKLNNNGMTLELNPHYFAS
tara:strand:- start:1209 stop:1775 length:567 start_codon:yes stop_codon:yes gene_type:complete